MIKYDYKKKRALGWVSPLKGRKLSPETCQKRSETLKKLYASGKRKPSFGMLGKKHNVECKHAEK